MSNQEAIKSEVENLQSGIEEYNSMVNQLNVLMIDLERDFESLEGYEELTVCMGGEGFTKIEELELTEATYVVQEDLLETQEKSSRFPY